MDSTELLNYYVYTEIKTKSKNRRLNIFLIVEPNTKEKIVILRNKRLLDRSSREIITTETLFTLESFVILSNVINQFVLNDLEFMEFLSCDIDNIKSKTNINVYPKAINI